MALDKNSLNSSLEDVKALSVLWSGTANAGDTIELSDDIGMYRELVFYIGSQPISINYLRSGSVIKLGAIFLDNYGIKPTMITTALTRNSNTSLTVKGIVVYQLDVDSTSWVDQNEAGLGANYPITVIYGMSPKKDNNPL